MKKGAGSLFEHENSRDAILNYLYDTGGNRTTEKIVDKDGTLKKYLAREYDADNRLWKESCLEGSFSEYQYDTNSNITSFTDPAGKTTQYVYDDFNRLAKQTDPLDRVTSFS